MGKIVEIEMTVEVPDEETDNVLFEDAFNDLFVDLLYDYTDVTLHSFLIKGVYDNDD